jgi:aspartate aminotransferase-like enzyme
VARTDGVLLTPGPVPVLPEIRRAQDRVMITHRSPEFSQLYGDLCRRFAAYTGATEAYVLTGSGALGLEALFASLTDRQETALCLPNGEFGDKLAETAGVYTTVRTATLPGGQGWNLARAQPHIDGSGASVLALVYNETGYGVRNDVAAICQYAKAKGMLTIVDGISAWPGTPFNLAQCGVDGFVTGSQKGIGAPPGLAVVALSPTAVTRLAQREAVPSYCLDLRRYRKRFAKDQQTPNTPAISLLWALQKAFDVLDQRGGVAAAVERHAAAAAHVRQRLTALGFDLVAEPGYASHTVTGFVCRDAAEAQGIKATLQREHGITIAGCRGAYADRGLRLAHMGNFEPHDLDACLDAIAALRR